MNSSIQPIAKIHDIHNYTWTLDMVYIIQEKCKCAQRPGLASYLFYVVYTIIHDIQYYTIYKYTL